MFALSYSWYISILNMYFGKCFISSLTTSCSFQTWLPQFRWSLAEWSGSHHAFVTCMRIQEIECISMLRYQKLCDISCDGYCLLQIRLREEVYRLKDFLTWHSRYSSEQRNWKCQYDHKFKNIQAFSSAYILSYLSLFQSCGFCFLD